MTPVLLLTALQLVATPSPATNADTLVFLALQPKGGISRATAELLADRVLQRVNESGAFHRVVSPRELANTLPKAQREQLLACVQDQCSIVDNELVGVVGATHLLQGDVGRIGNSYVVTLKLLELRSGSFVAIESQERQGTSEDTLLQLVPLTVDGLLQKAHRAPVTPEKLPAAAARPVWPRIGGGITLGAAGVAALLTLGAVASGLSWLLLFESPATLAHVPHRGVGRNAWFGIRWGLTGSLAVGSVVIALLALGLGVLGGALVIGVAS